MRTIRYSPHHPVPRQPTWRLAAVVLLALGLLALFWQPAQADDGTIGWEEYWQRLENTRDRLVELESLPEADAKPALQELAEEWTAVQAVELPDGGVVPIDDLVWPTMFLVDGANPGELRQAVEETLAARDTWPTGSYGPEDLERMRAILARPPYQWPPDGRNLLEELLRWLERFLPQGTVGGINLQWLCSGLSIFILLALFFWIFRGMVAQLIAEARLKEEGPDGEEILTANRALQQAQNFSDSGDYRTAVRYLYLSSLLLLEERDLLRYDHSLTNREYLRLVAHRPELASILESVIDVFDRVWYGFQSIDEPTYRRYAEQVASLKEQK